MKWSQVSSKLGGLSQRAVVTGLGVLALGVNLVFLSLLPARWMQNENTDYFTNYEPAARNLLAGKGPVGNDGKLEVRYPPGFPIVLAVLFKSAAMTGLSESFLIRSFNAVVSLVTTILVFLIAASAFERLPAILAAVGWATYPFHLWLNKQPNSEVPFFIPLFLALFVFYRALGEDRFRSGTAVCLGSLIAVASLVRPITIAFSVPLAVSLWVTKKSWTRKQKVVFCALLFLSNAVVVSPWQVYAWSRTGQWIPLSTNGRYSTIEGLWMANRDLHQMQKTGSQFFSPDVVNLMTEAYDRQQEFRSQGDIARFLAGKFAEQPGTVLRYLLLKATRAWYATNSQRFDRWIRWAQMVYLTFAVIGMWITWKLGRRARAYVVGAVLVAAYFWGMAILVVPLLRYMLPVMALLMVFVGVTLLRLSPFSGPSAPLEAGGTQFPSSRLPVAR